MVAIQGTKPYKHFSFLRVFFSFTVFIIIYINIIIIMILIIIDVLYCCTICRGACHGTLSWVGISANTQILTHIC